VVRIAEFWTRLLGECVAPTSLEILKNRPDKCLSKYSRYDSLALPALGILRTSILFFCDFLIFLAHRVHLMTCQMEGWSKHTLLANPKDDGSLGGVTCRKRL